MNPEKLQALETAWRDRMMNPTRFERLCHEHVGELLYQYEYEKERADMLHCKLNMLLED
jgi:hypothetical protein